MIRFLLVVQTGLDSNDVGARICGERQPTIIEFRCAFVISAAIAN
jgi:hypothetical protein